MTDLAAAMPSWGGGAGRASRTADVHPLVRRVVRDPTSNALLLAVALDRADMLESLIEAAPDVYTSDVFRSDRQAVVDSEEGRPNVRIFTLEQFAAEVGSVGVIKLLKSSFGRFADPGTLLVKALNTLHSVAVALWLLSDEDVVELLAQHQIAAVEVVFAALRCMLFIVDLDGARALAKACVPLVSSIAGFPRADDYTTLGSYIRMCPPGHLRAVLPSLCKDLRLGPKATSEKDIFPALLDEPFSDDLQLSMQLPPEKPLIDLLRDRSRVFLALLEAPSLRDAERRMIAKRYAAACEEQFKDPSFFARLRSLGLYAPTAGSLARFLTRPRFRYGENVQLLGFLKSAMTEPESRRDFFRTVRWALENHPAPPESSHMVLAIHQLAHRDGFEDLLHSLLCLLMFKGADSTDYLLRDAVLGTDTLTGRLLPGFADDVTEVKQWMRWVQNGHIGKLPPELAEMVAIQVWEDAAAACVP